MAGKLTLMEELKLRHKERSSRLEAKSDEESTPIKPNTSPFLTHRNPNPKPSKAYQTSLSDIVGSTDQIDQVLKSRYNRDENQSNINTLSLWDEEEKYEQEQLEQRNDDTMSIYTDSSCISTTASLQSLNGLNGRKKRKKKRKKKSRIIQDGSHVTCNQYRKSSVSRSSDIPPIEHTPPNTPPMHLHRNKRIKRNIPTGLGTIGDGIPHDLSVDDKLWSTNIFAFIASVDLMINIPTLYNASVDLFIWILVIYVMFQVIAALIISIFMNYERIKWILVSLGAFLFVGNVLYTHGISDDTDSDIVLLFIARAMCGISGSILINGYSINTLCSNILNRETLIVMFRFITSIGMIIGPLCGLLLSIVPQFNVSTLYNIKDTNIGSFAMSCLALLYIIVFLLYLMYNYFIKSKKKQEKMDECENDIANIHEKTGKNYVIKDTEAFAASSEEIVKRRQYADKYNAAVLLSDSRLNHSLFFSKYVALLLFLYISCLFTFWSMYAVILPIGAYNDDTYNQTLVYGVFALIGFVYILSFFINRCLNYRLFTKTSFDKRVIVAIHIQCIGYFLLTTFGVNEASLTLTQLIFGICLIVMGFVIATLQIPAIFCRITGTKLKNIGIRMSWFFIISSIGRIIGPIFAWFIIKNQNGSIDLLSHLFAFYLIIISFIALIVLMETNRDYYYAQNREKDQEQQAIPMITLHSNRKVVHRVPSRSITQSVTPYSHPKLHQTKSNDREQSKEEDKSKDKDDDDDEYMDNKDKKKHFNYSPVHRTESEESIKVSYKPKKTFIEKYSIDELELLDGDDLIDLNKNNDDSKNAKSTRLSRFFNKNNDDQKQDKISKVHNYHL